MGKIGCAAAEFGVDLQSGGLNLLVISFLYGQKSVKVWWDV